MYASTSHVVSFPLRPARRHSSSCSSQRHTVPAGCMSDGNECDRFGLIIIVHKGDLSDSSASRGTSGVFHTLYPTEMRVQLVQGRTAINLKTVLQNTTVPALSSLMCHAILDHREKSIALCFPGTFLHCSPAYWAQRSGRSSSCKMDD